MFNFQRSSGSELMYRAYQCFGAKRESNVKYAIGMIVRKKYIPEVKGETGDDEIVVITGWMYTRLNTSSETPNHRRDVLYNAVSDDDHESKMIKQSIVLFSLFQLLFIFIFLFFLIQLLDYSSLRAPQFGGCE